ncbi:MAG: response regulator [Pseudomonadota bacterium]
MAYQFSDVQILVVEDMLPILGLTKSVLQVFGFKNLVSAKNGEEAFKVFCEHNPDLVITDWIMEPMDGLELIDQIRENPKSPNPYVPIILMTGYSNRVRVESARDQGVTEFLAKPYTARDLYNRIVQIIENPRQFVKTQDFFGPDRRRRKGEGYGGPQRRQSDEISDEQEQAAEKLLKQMKNDTKEI